MTLSELPNYADLPRTADGAPSAWSCFAPSDNVGLLGLQTPDRVLAASRLVRRGAVFALNADIDALRPPLFGRPIARHQLLGSGVNGFDDELSSLNPQSSSQWDALGHAAFRDGVYFNGVTADQVRSGRNTIDHWARRGIVGRGVMLDIAAPFSEWLPDYSPGAEISISVEDLDRCRVAAGVVYEPGDILLLHTGFLHWFISLDDAERAAVARADRVTSVGLEHSEEMAAYLWDAHVCAVVSDNPAVEVWPPDPSRGVFGALHSILIAQFGMALGELWWLHDLAEDCRADGVGTMFVTSAPLNVRGGISSPSNALAIK